MNIVSTIWTFLWATHFGLYNWTYLLVGIFLGLAVLASFIQKKRALKWDMSLNADRFSNYEARTEHRPGLEVMQAQKAAKVGEVEKRAKLRAEVGAEKASQITARQHIEARRAGSRTWQHFHPPEK